MAVHTVGEGGDFATIGAAVEAAESGDVIEVRGGIYRETVKLTKAVTLRAAPGESPIIDGGWNGQTTEDTFGGTVACAAEGVASRGVGHSQLSGPGHRRVGVECDGARQPN